jgi:osmotically-inducible protein OsmY
MLQGCVASMAVSAAAGAGIVARQERSIASAATDTNIIAAINAGLLQRDTALFTHVDAQAYEGRVLLSGPVATPEAKAEVVDVARNVPGVRDVIDETEVGGSAGDYALDSWISAEMRSKLLFDPDVRSINYSVHVVNQTIYLIGVAQSEGELQRVLAHAGDIEYVRRVVDHVLLKDDPRRAL